MHFAASALALLASATVASAGSVTFWTLDNETRKITFVPTSGGHIEPVTVSNKEKTKVEFPDSWIGNFYAFDEKNGKDEPGMLGEVTFGGFGGQTYFDVSAIVKPGDHNNVKQMWPIESQTPMSGCKVFPCNNCYWHPDDKQTKVTDEVHLMTTLGEGSTGIKFSS